MAKVCNTCGLPTELCVCEDVAKTEQKLEVHVEERRYDKEVTVASGFRSSEIDIDELSSELKSSFACGGTVDGDSIELQGNHREGLIEELENRGFEVEA